MIVGCLREIKDNENRVALTPSGAKELVRRGHEVLMEKDAGAGSAFSDQEYRDAGAEVVTGPGRICERAGLILKIKEPLKGERGYFRKGQILFTYFHFASDRELALAMMRSGAACIAYETVERDGRTVLLAPMSEVAGKMAPLMGCYYLAKPRGGRGVLFTGVAGTEPATIAIIGGGFVGRSAAKVSLGLGARTVILESDPGAIERLRREFPAAEVIASNAAAIMQSVKVADVVVGAVLIRGEKAPKLITRDMVKSMRPGSVIVDVAIDQGGVAETSRPTTHSDPVFTVDGVIHYCVTNMPGAFPRTSTLALTNATLPYAIRLADMGLGALKGDEGFAKGLNIQGGRVVNRSVADTLSLDWSPAAL